LIDYSDKVMEHFMTPSNLGYMADADGVGEIGDPDCGDHLKVFIKVVDGSISDIRFLIKGCPAAIACASAMTELVKGKRIEEAMLISDDDIVDYIDGLPEFKIHCSALGAAGFRVAVMDYFTKKGSP